MVPSDLQDLHKNNTFSFIDNQEEEVKIDNVIVNFATTNLITNNCECTKILIVDDNTFNIYTLKLLLEV